MRSWSWDFSKLVYARRPRLSRFKFRSVQLHFCPSFSAIVRGRVLVLPFHILCVFRHRGTEGRAPTRPSQHEISRVHRFLGAYSAAKMQIKPQKHLHNSTCKASELIFEAAATVFAMTAAQLHQLWTARSLPPPDIFPLETDFVTQGLELNVAAALSYPPEKKGRSPAAIQTFCGW